MEEIKPKRLISRIVEFAALFALASFLIRLAICWLMEIWWILVIVGTIALVATIGFRIWKSRNTW